MVIQANVCAVGKVQEGVSARTGNPWRKQQFVVEWFIHKEDTQSQKIVLTLLGDRIEQFNLKVGDKVEVRFDLRYREYEGIFYQDSFMPHDGLRKLSAVQSDTADLQPEKPAQPNNNPPGFERPATSDGNNPPGFERPATSDGNNPNQEGGNNDDLPF